MLWVLSWHDSSLLLLLLLMLMTLYSFISAPDNKQSQKIAQKKGAQFTGKLRSKLTGKLH